MGRGDNRLTRKMRRKKNQRKKKEALNKKISGEKKD